MIVRRLALASALVLAPPAVEQGGERTAPRLEPGNPSKLIRFERTEPVSFRNNRLAAGDMGSAFPPNDRRRHGHVVANWRFDRARGREYFIRWRERGGFQRPTPGRVPEALEVPCEAWGWRTHHQTGMRLAQAVRPGSSLSAKWSPAVAVIGRARSVARRLVLSLAAAEAAPRRGPWPARSGRHKRYPGLGADVEERQRRRERRYQPAQRLVPGSSGGRIDRGRQQPTVDVDRLVGAERAHVLGPRFDECSLRRLPKGRPPQAYRAARRVSGAASSGARTCSTTIRARR